MYHNESVAMSTISVEKDQPHRNKEPEISDFGMSPNLCGRFIQDLTSEDESIYAGVTKLLDRNEAHRDPRAHQAIRAEGEALIKEKTWLEETVIEKDELVTSAKKQEKKIILAELMTIASIKYYEMSPNMWKYKGRICFRGDCAKDANGAYAVYEAVSYTHLTLPTKRIV